MAEGIDNSPQNSRYAAVSGTSSCAPRCPLHDSVPFVLHSHAKRHAHATATTATANTNNDVCTSVDIV